MTYYIIGALVTLWITGSIYRRINRRSKIIYAIEDNCTGCGKCVKRCHHHVLEVIKDEKGTCIAVKNLDKCSACGDCVDVCKFKALEIVGRQKNRRL
jgi:NAD-dependent dihydropyrimidine dehydrogenase PreA subunit